MRLGGGLPGFCAIGITPISTRRCWSACGAKSTHSIALERGTADQCSVVTYPPDLPITARKDDIVAAIRAHQVIVIAGETGSGKTTQIPKMCLEAGLGIEAKIGCTQPRRVAALSISRRIAEELNVELGPRSRLQNSL